MRGRPARVAACLALAASLGARPAAASLDARERRVLTAYLAALHAGRYATAFSLLDPGERRYFASATNFATVFDADRFVLESYRIVRSESTHAGAVAIVSERVRFRDHAHASDASLVANVPYGVVHPGNRPAIHDPGHPWRAFAPAALSAEIGGVRVTVRKISFFTGRIEIVLTVANRSAAAVTLLPFGRSTLRDGSGGIFHPLATRSAALTDANLYVGLRVPSSGEYTGFLTFATPARFEPATLSLTVAPALAAGGDEPFAIALPTFAVRSGRDARPRPSAPG